MNKKRQVNKDLNSIRSNFYINYIFGQHQNYNKYVDLPIIDGSYKFIYDPSLGWCVDIIGNVNLTNLSFRKFPVQFRNVSGYFDCRFCGNLTTLKNCPISVGEYFDCRGCFKLKSLKYHPINYKELKYQI